MATPFHAELVTPERVLFAGDVDEVSMRSDAGEIAFLAAHEDYVAAVDITVVRLNAVGGAEGERHEVRAAVHGGFVQVDASGVKILAGVAELASEIDVDRARRALAATEAPGGAEPADTGVQVGADAGEGALRRPSGAMLALLDPGAPDAVARRARTRLEAAGAS